MSQTAERWWVRTAARWLARIDGVSGQLRLAMLGLTGISTATLTLKEYGHGDYAWPLIGVIGAGTIIYTYYYTEGGVWNQTSRDKTDLSTNYSGPTMLMDAQIEARQLALLGYVLQTDEDMTYDEVKQRMIDATTDEWASMRDGVDIEAIEQ